MQSRDAKRAGSPKQSPRGAEPRTGRSKGILVVSNRLPVTLSRGSAGIEVRPSSGGLVSALEPVLQRRGGVWIGWPGMELPVGETLPSGNLPYRMQPVVLTDTEVSRYYYGFSNRALWPLFHSLVERARFDPREWAVYERVNVRFAQLAATAAPNADFVWIHDYHLFRTPRHLRRLVPEARIAFFLHTPFPPYDVFRILPWGREILRGLLACDLVGFHVTDYAQNFLNCTERLLGARVDRTALLAEEGDQTVRVGAFPLGIDLERFEEQARSAPQSGRMGERIVLGVDRLDYTKGIPERIRSFERFLELYPQYREQVTLVQIAVPTRSQVAEYRALKREIDELVGRVNGRFGTAAWSPIRYLYRSFSQERLAGLYRDADVALITPLRDGMNLVAKEFVACQVDKPGVLILSQLAGTAETMHEAIRVNPYNVDATAGALHRALAMEEPERWSRLAALRRRERRDNVHAWTEKFLKAALEAPAGLRPPTGSDFETWLGQFLFGYRLALFVDYDGTLVPFHDHPAEATLSASLQRALEACARRADSDVTVISGRALDDIVALIKNPRITVAANDGLEIVGPKLTAFRHPDLSHYMPRTQGLVEALAPLATEGAWIEEKGPAITVHYRQVSPQRRSRLIERIRDIISESGFQARDTQYAVEGRPPIGFDRGQAVLHILRSRYGADWSETVRVVYVGDDQIDEDAFRLFAGLGFTFRVGSAETQTHARRRLPNVKAVDALLQWLAERAEAPVEAVAS